LSEGIEGQPALLHYAAVLAYILPPANAA